MSYSGVKILRHLWCHSLCFRNVGIVVDVSCSDYDNIVCGCCRGKGKLLVLELFPLSIRTCEGNFCSAVEAQHMKLSNSSWSGSWKCLPLFLWLICVFLFRSCVSGTFGWEWECRQEWGGQQQSTDAVKVTAGRKQRQMLLITALTAAQWPSNQQKLVQCLWLCSWRSADPYWLLLYSRPLLLQLKKDPLWQTLVCEHNWETNYHCGSWI